MATRLFEPSTRTKLSFESATYRYGGDCHGSLEDYGKVRGSYRLTVADLTEAKPEMIVMRPLPRVDEIEYAGDDTAHARYFKHVWYGLLVRMSLMRVVLGASTYHVVT